MKNSRTFTNLEPPDLNGIQLIKEFFFFKKRKEILETSIDEFLIF